MHTNGHPETTFRNKRPIFIVAFAYGGSNILLNLLRTHPDVVSPRGELNEVFKGRIEEPWPTRLAKQLRYLPCALIERRDIFSFNNWEPRAPFRPVTRNLVDRILYQERFRAQHESQNLWKHEGVKYTREEIASGRLLCKNLDGLILLSRELQGMYPDATFIGLVRNGFAVCEGHMRRGHSLETIAQRYEQGCQQMLADARDLPRYHIVRYEDLVARPQEMLREVYRMADLDIGQIQKVRLQTKRVMRADGTHALARDAKAQDARFKEVVWYGLDEFGKHFKNDANANQIKRLTDEQRATILRMAGKSLQHFRYTAGEAASSPSSAPAPLK